MSLPLPHWRRRHLEGGQGRVLVAACIYSMHNNIHLLRVGCQGTLECYLAVTLFTCNFSSGTITKVTCSLNLNALFVI
jgi:hypothetical protein